MEKLHHGVEGFGGTSKVRALACGFANTSAIRAESANQRVAFLERYQVPQMAHLDSARTCAGCGLA
jgi:hypothetical protein